MVCPETSPPEETFSNVNQQTRPFEIWERQDNENISFWSFITFQLWSQCLTTHKKGHNQPGRCWTDTPTEEEVGEMERGEGEPEEVETEGGR